MLSFATQKPKRKTGFLQTSGSEKWIQIVDLHNYLQTSDILAWHKKGHGQEHTDQL